MMRLSSIANANVRALFETTKKIGKKRVKTSFFLLYLRRERSFIGRFVVLLQPINVNGLRKNLAQKGIK